MSTITKHRPAKQAWEVGQIVKSGFVDNLVVKQRIPTPGDGRPDIFVLWRPETNRWYTFQPHLGLRAHDSEASARGV